MVCLFDYIDEAFSAMYKLAHTRTNEFQLTSNFYEEFTGSLVSCPITCRVQNLIPPPGK